MENMRSKSKCDLWMWTTLIAATLCFSFGIVCYNAFYGRGIPQLAIFVGFAALLSFFLRLYYRKSR